MHQNSTHLVLITGVTGRVGSHLVPRLLDRGVRVRGLVMPNDPLRSQVHPEVEVIEGDLFNNWALQSAVEDVTAIVHLAAVILYQPHEDDLIWKVNVEGTRNLLAAVRRRRQAPLRLAFASSDQVYPGPFPRYTPTDEGHPLEPITSYGLSKLIGEELVRQAARTLSETQFTIARFCHNQTWQEVTDPQGFFAGRQFYVRGRLTYLEESRRTDAVTTESIRRLSEVDLEDEPLLLGLTEEGEALTMDILDTREIAAGLVPALFHSHAANAIFNFAPEGPVSLAEVIPYMGRALRRRWVEVRLPGEPARSHLSGKKARDLLGVRQQFTIFDMIDAAVQKKAS